MGIFDFLKRNDINQGFEEFRRTEGAMLLDVRSAEEFAEGHLPGSVNLPLPALADGVKTIAPSTPVFVYCRSGARSGRAADELMRMGYGSVKNIGGILDYKGDLSL
ncbi:MAG: rhodanese-like domain-containing protein [Acidaminococcaceae bacterium]|nr:rhodanese-like domain-containing protein [Acidaminococcaceae bacterium]